MKGLKSRVIQLGQGLGILGALCVVVALAAFIIHLSGFTQVKNALGASLAARISKEIESLLASKVALGQRLASALEANPSLSEAQQSAIASAIMGSDSTITSVIIAPGAIVKLHFPPSQGEALIGHDLLSNPERRDSLVKAAEARGAIIAGPYETVEGNQIGFIRYPIYSGGKLWGFASITFDFAAFYDSLGLAQDFPDLGIGLFMSENGTAAYKIAGDDGRGVLRHAQSPIAAYGLSWVLVLAPRSGWGYLDFSLIVLFAMALISSFALIALYITSARNKKEKVDATAPQPAKMEAQARAPKEVSKGEGNTELEAEPEAESLGDFLDFEEMAKKKGRKLRFRGPSVKGELYMPEKGNAKPIAVESPESSPAPAEAEMVELPIKQAAAEEKPSATPALALVLGPLFHEERASILVVDDSEVNRDLVGRMLSLKGYSTEFADSGSAALARCREGTYDLIFLDCFMPGMDGYKTSVLLREEGLRRSTKIIGMSARVGPRELETCKAAGMDDVLAKPFTSKQLFESLAKNLVRNS